jgi:regulator of protease activity HflC (stomatin/prohibitin superfamily)
MALRYVALRAVGIAELALARSRAGAHHANAACNVVARSQQQPKAFQSNDASSKGYQPFQPEDSAEFEPASGGSRWLRGGDRYHDSIFGGPKFNTVVVFVPQMEEWIIERFGKFSRILNAGLNLIIPVADRIAKTISLKEIAKRIPSQPVITADNVMLDIDGILYFKVNDPYKACYGVKNPDYAIEQIAMTTMRSEIGKITLDNLFRERENLNTQIVASLSIAVDPWGVQIMRYEIRDIKLPSGVQRAMVMIVEAERKKRAAILESQGRKQAEINIAEGQRAARILSSEADKQEEINRAHGDAAAVIARAEAHAKSLEILASKLDTPESTQLLSKLQKITSRPSESLPRKATQ